METLFVRRSDEPFLEHFLRRILGKLQVVDARVDRGVGRVALKPEEIKYNYMLSR